MLQDREDKILATTIALDSIHNYKFKDAMTVGISAVGTDEVETVRTAWERWYSPAPIAPSHAEQVEQEEDTPNTTTHAQSPS